MNLYRRMGSAQNMTEILDAHEGSCLYTHLDLDYQYMHLAPKSLYNPNNKQQITSYIAVVDSVAAAPTHLLVRKVHLHTSYVWVCG